jgi:hypothetical protein
MKDSLLLLIVLTAAITAFAAEDKPPVFSHKTHAPLKYPCVKCHAGATTGESARFPAASVCETCHPGRAVPQLPSERVYQLPAMVIFSHARHAAAKTECAACHGDVNQYHRLRVELPTNMKACVECHKKGGATTACKSCHELGQ